MVRIISMVIPAVLLIGCAAQNGNAPAAMASDTGRQNVPVQWWAKANVIVRASLKSRGGRGAGFPLDPAKASEQLDALKAMGVSAIEIYGPQLSGTAYGGLDPIDNFQPSMGTMDDFRTLVKVIHSKGMAAIVFINIGYTSIQSPEWIKACQDVKAGRDTREARRFWWADRPDAPEPPGDSIFSLADPQRVWKYIHGPDAVAPADFASLDDAGRGHWEFSEQAGKYYWTKWGQRMGGGGGFGVQAASRPAATSGPTGRGRVGGQRVGLPHYNWANPEWQQDAEKILRFWMDTGLDGMIMDAPGMYSGSNWEITRRRITGVIDSYGNVLMQPEGGGSLFEDPEAWITEGGFNCMQDYRLMELRGLPSPVRVALESGDPRPIEACLEAYHDRVVAQGGVLYLTTGGRLRVADEQKQQLALEIGVLAGDIVSCGTAQALRFPEGLQRLFALKQEHPALQNLATRRPIRTTADDKHYAFLRTAADRSERILVVINVQPTEQTIDMDLSGVANAGLVDLANNLEMPRTSYFKATVPALSYRLFVVKPPVELP